MTTTTKAIRIEEFGGPENMHLVEVEVGEPGPGQIRIRHQACGLNFIDVYQRGGVYPLPLPVTLGMEAAGEVEAVGEGVTHLAPGDRAAYASAPPGAYCGVRVMNAMHVCKLPDSVSFEQGAAMMLQGLTVQYLFATSARAQPGDTVLFHAAAGGVGLIACQWARAMDVTLIGTAGTDEKCALAKEHGAAHAINYTTRDFVAEVKEITGGKGVDAVLDSVGKATWEGSLDCLKPLGVMVTFGNASGKPDPFDPQILAGKGSLFLTRPTLFTHIASREACQQRADELFEMVTSGKVKIRINQTYALADVAQAHRDLEARKTTGTTILLP
ncbi:MAG: quinone oxidoreductase [Proteobacteria bacterium]|nr:quinone oxidoreductase [Pseudomonadota bacterium]